MALSLKQVQDVELEIMQAVHVFCKEHGLRYALAYGTLIGAVRHKGFVPWDNDMDIYMPRPDYEKLVRMLSVEGYSIGKHYYMLHHSVDPNYHYQVIRICDDRTSVKPVYIGDQPERMGAWVDIFAVDGIPEGHWWSRYRLYFNKMIQIADVYTVPGRRDFWNIVGIVMRTVFPGRNKHNRMIDKIAMKFSYDESRHVGDTTERNKHFIRMDRSDFDEAYEVPFEKYCFRIPKGYDAILRQCYGDYMVLPPPEKRMTHDINVEWIE